MDAYLDSLIQVVHSVFKGAICESGVPHSHYAKYHNLNRGKYVCECDNYAISDVTTMDLTTYIWLDDVHLTYQEMYAANLPCDETMIIILTEVRSLFPAVVNTSENYMNGCVSIYKLFKHANKVPIGKAISMFKQTICATQGDIHIKSKASFRQVLELHNLLSEVNERWEMDSLVFENSLQWLPREIMEMTTELLTI
jgi:hypothetical protein